MNKALSCPLFSNQPYSTAGLLLGGSPTSGSPTSRATDPLGSLFVQVNLEPGKGFSFQINPASFLLAEHFPGFPVIPASLIVGLVFEQVKQLMANEAEGLCLTNIRFNLPLVPGRNYYCQLQLQPKSASWLFAISDDQGALYTRGLLRGIELVENHTEEDCYYVS